MTSQVYYNLPLCRMRGHVVTFMTWHVRDKLLHTLWCNICIYIYIYYIAGVVIYNRVHGIHCTVNTMYTVQCTVYIVYGVQYTEHHINYLDHITIYVNSITFYTPIRCRLLHCIAYLQLLITHIHTLTRAHTYTCASTHTHAHTHAHIHAYTHGGYIQYL